MITETSVAYVFPVSGWRLGRCCAEDDGFSIEILDTDGESARANLTEFRFRDSDGMEREIDGADYREATPIFDRLGTLVEGALVTKDGQFRVKFRDGAEIVAPRMEGVEAWEVLGPGELFVIAPTGPGEEVSIFGRVVLEGS